MTLRSLIQEAAAVVGIPRPANVFTSSDLAVQQLLSLAQRELKTLAAEHDWPALASEHVFTTAAASEQPNGLPPDFERFINGTMWNRTRNVRVNGPIDSQVWQRAQIEPGILISSLAWRLRGVRLHLLPVPPAGETIAFEFVSKRLVQAGGFKRWVFEADDDECLLDENLITLGTVWRFKAAKGLDYAEDLDNYERAKARAIGQTGGAPVLRTDCQALVGPSDPQVPEGSWGMA